MKYSLSLKLLGMLTAASMVVPLGLFPYIPFRSGSTDSTGIPSGTGTRMSEYPAFVARL